MCSRVPENGDVDYSAILEFTDDGNYRARCRHPVEAEATGVTSYQARLALESTLKGHITEQFELMPLEATISQPWIANGWLGGRMTS